MDIAKRKRLVDAGWRVGTAEEFLDLSPEESAFIDLKLSLSDGLRERRTAESISQAQLAQRIGSSQSRLAKAEAGKPGVSLDLLVRALLALGATREDIARMIDVRRHESG